MPWQFYIIMNIIITGTTTKPSQWRFLSNEILSWNQFSWQGINLFIASRKTNKRNFFYEKNIDIFGDMLHWKETWYSWLSSEYLIRAITPLPANQIVASCWDKCYPFIQNIKMPFLEAKKVILLNKAFWYLGVIWGAMRVWWWCLRDGFHWCTLPIYFVGNTRRAINLPDSK